MLRNKAQAHQNLKGDQAWGFEIDGSATAKTLHAFGNTTGLDVDAIIDTINTAFRNACTQAGMPNGILQPIELEMRKGIWACLRRAKEKAIGHAVTEEA